MLTDRKFFYLFFITLLFGGCLGAALTNKEIDTKLSDLKVLPKIHYYWPIGSEVSEFRIYHLVRITHSACVSGEWVTAKDIDKMVYACARVNKTKPVIEARLGLSFIPWHNKFDKNLSPISRDSSYFRELSFFDERCVLIKRWIAESNKKYGSDIKVGGVLLDCERFTKREGTSASDLVWNDAIRDCLDKIHERAIKHFCEARIEWFARGIQPAQSSEGWHVSQHWTGKEIKSSLSCMFYRVPELELTRETLRRTVKLASSMGIDEVTPWVALASGYRRTTTEFEKFSLNWDYDIIYSWMIGQELNNPWYGQRPERFAPYSNVKVIVFYPAPFDKRVPHHSKHFIAYVRGATGVKDLEDIGFEKD